MTGISIICIQVTLKQPVLGHDFRGDPRIYGVVWMSYERREKETAARAVELGIDISNVYFMSPVPAEGDYASLVLLHLS